MSIIEALKKSRQNYEAAAFTDGSQQAKKLITDEPDFKFLSEMCDNATAFKADKEFDINFIDNLNEYPANLRFHVIKGFFDTMTKITELTKPCSNGGACNPSCNICEDGITVEDMKQVGVYTGVNVS